MAPAAVDKVQTAAAVRAAKKLQRELARLDTAASGLPSGVLTEAAKKRKRDVQALIAAVRAAEGRESGEEEEEPGITLSDVSSEDDAADPPFVPPSAKASLEPRTVGLTDPPLPKAPAKKTTAPSSEVPADQMRLLLQAVQGIAAQVSSLQLRLEDTQTELAEVKARRHATAPKLAPGRKEVPPLAVAASAGLHLNDEADDESDEDVLEAKKLLRMSLQKKAAKATASPGKSTIRTDGLSAVESMEALMAGPGGYPASLEHTLVHKLTVFMNESPPLYAKVPTFAKTDLKTFARNYDRIRFELLERNMSVFSSAALEAAAQDVQLRYIEVFVQNKPLVKALKTVVRPEDDHLFQLMGGSAERLTLMHSRAKQASYLQGLPLGTKPAKDDESLDTPDASGTKGKKK